MTIAPHNADSEWLIGLTGYRIIHLIAIVVSLVAMTAAFSKDDRMIVIDDLSATHPLSSLGTQWMLVTDTVMGGVSRGRLVREEVVGRKAARMTGAVSLENDGGFIQMALDLAPEGQTLDASEFTGIEIDVYGKGEEYELRLRTTDLTRSWQSYRQAFMADQSWKTIRLPFSGFQAHRTDTPLNLAVLRRIGLIAIGRAFDADLALGGVRFY